MIITGDFEDTGTSCQHMRERDGQDVKTTSSSEDIHAYVVRGAIHHVFE